jgi:electron transfer flavoprotein alpha subunit
MVTLIVVEHNNQVMHPVTRHVVSAGMQLNSPCVLLVMGFNCTSVAEEAAKLSGTAEVWLVDDSAFEHQLPENMAQVIANLSSKFNAVLVSSSTFGKNLLPRVAALLDAAQISDVTRVIDAETFEHPIYAGNAIETVQVLDTMRVLTIRATAFEGECDAQPACTIKKLSMDIAAQHSKWVKSELNQSTRPELTQAKIVVSGGRGLQNQESFQLIEKLADCLGGAVGASRAAVDAGFAPNDYQVGQTGKVVAPQLYIAIGISGAVQHLAGMKDSKVIVSINKDEDAPINQLASYYLVGDLFELVPKLIEKIKSQS